ncbi:MAG: HAD-IB family hydrolase [Candidatus Thiodiazotropha lotti]|uniref:Histidinol-phosphatase n=1 Tax=Candidatus Thiodiazotropha endoloripes TaxID=1818881 RepID=A0A1E2UKX4_9GAMM|nr:HAD family hydrolase [Candidatus Thiodiazotropha endoloripes]MCG7898242.1 HAD-IB family hydrolase [Candidatus Thiodiazotropha weberae]MCG7992185.1 HAD-IB family hydrolase [Candidatus Thiodiazotropha lotti]MCG7903339.1 HAD-IB family hydrolase [Candidatus Thiodiazotropha weberae]MCG7915301.1 HAD-IB family hydrolase [Candidatus Thiodiazotropha weberae]MCG7998690.1 HAD-IB family hydrolase [Candidatus Thiodiazotropha lotti]
MALAIFDLDNTLLAGDSDYLWGRFLVEQGIVDGEQYERENERFYEDYKAGRLDIHEFMRFSLKPLRKNPPEKLNQWRALFIEEKITPLISKQARQLVEKHRQAGDLPLIITATNAFVTSPIAQRFGIDHLIATEPEQIDGHYTGEVAGTPSFREGKVSRLNDWLDEFEQSMQGSWFYSDSHNDLPLLEQVEHPVAVDPDQTLAEVAKQRNWPILQLHSR